MKFSEMMVPGEEPGTKRTLTRVKETYVQTGQDVTSSSGRVYLVDAIALTFEGRVVEVRVGEGVYGFQNGDLNVVDAGLVAIKPHSQDKGECFRVEALITLLDLRGGFHDYSSIMIDSLKVGDEIYPNRH